MVMLTIVHGAWSFVLVSTSGATEGSWLVDALMCCGGGWQVAELLQDRAVVDGLVRMLQVSE